MTTTLPTTSGADSQLRQRVAAAPHETDARRKLARHCLVEGRSQEAAEHYATILKKNERDVEALTQLASFYIERGALDHATPLYKALYAINPQNKTALFHLVAMQALEERQRAAGVYGKLCEKLVSDTDEISPLGLQKEHVPCLISMNGDLRWLPGDLLRYLWHTAQKPMQSAVPAFIAETQHYVWVRDHIAAGEVVFDIGANIGIFSVMMGTKVGASGRVFSFEPSARFAADLRRVIQLNELSQVTVVEAAVSIERGETVFLEVQETDVRREGSQMSDPRVNCVVGAHNLKEVVVKTVILDEFVEEQKVRPALLKIDVEGAEFLVLEGAQKTIAACKPKLVIEIHPNTDGVFDHARLTTYLKRFGYQYTTETKTYYCW